MRLRRYGTLRLLLVLVCWLQGSPAYSEDTLFNSTAAWSQELSRMGGEATTMVRSPVDTYPVESVAVVGAFALAFAFDRDIRNDLAGNHSRTLSRGADVGSFIGNPYLHIGATAAAYGAGALADSPKVLDVSTKVGEALILADGAGFILKEAIGRGRPNTGRRNDRFKPFSFESSYDSIPSMHTASSFAVAHVLSRATESIPARIAYYTAATFVGFSRLYQEKHWASDVILGAALGELAGSAVTRYRSGKVTVAPVISGRGPGLAVVGTF